MNRECTLFLYSGKRNIRNNEACRLPRKIAQTPQGQLIMKSKYDISDNAATTESIRGGDKAAFDFMYRFYFKPLCAFASRFVSTGEEAENIVQDAMLWIRENRSTLLPNMSLKGLLFMIVRNKALDCVKHDNISGRVHKQLYHKFSATFDDPDFYLEQELTEMLEKAIAAMSPEFQEAFKLNRMQGMKHQEIAKQLGVSVQTVNYRISQAMKILRHELKDYLPLILLLLKIHGNLQS